MAKEIKSPVTGTIWKIEVSIGDVVKEEDDFIIIESMKMELPVVAEENCTVKEILCAEGEAVVEGHILLIVE